MKQLKPYPLIALIALSALLATPSVLAQVAGEKQTPGMPPNNGTLAEQNRDLLKGAEAKFTPVPQTESAPAAKLDFSDLTDHLAFVFDFQGDVRILKENADRWAPVKKEMKIEIGDQIFTGKDSNIDIAYDKHFLNIARIGANTKAEFVNIEPTDIHMEDGTIFSALDGLKKGESYQISTRTAVAGVRGTHFTVVSGPAAEALGLGHYAATVHPENDGKLHALEVKFAGIEQETVHVGEGEQVTVVAAGLEEKISLGKTAPQLEASANETLKNFEEEPRAQAAAQFAELGESAPALVDEDTEKIPRNNDGNDGGGNALRSGWDSLIDNALTQTGNDQGTLNLNVQEETSKKPAVEKVLSEPITVSAAEADLQADLLATVTSESGSPQADSSEMPESQLLAELQTDPDIDGAEARQGDVENAPKSTTANVGEPLEI